DVPSEALGHHGIVAPRPARLECIRADWIGISRERAHRETLVFTDDVGTGDRLTAIRGRASSRVDAVTAPASDKHVPRTARGAPERAAGVRLIEETADR